MVLCLFVGSKRFLTAVRARVLSHVALLDLAAIAAALHDRSAAADDRLAHDSLTGVLGRQALLTALDAAARPLTLMLAHVGGIDNVNRGMATEAGDATLRAVALALQGMVRRRDIVGRLSGVTFAIAGPGAPRSTTTPIAGPTACVKRCGRGLSPQGVCSSRHAA